MDAERRQMMLELRQAGRQSTLAYDGMEAEVEDAYWQLADEELALHGFERYPDVSLAVAEHLAHLKSEERQAIMAFCWLTYAWGWLHHHEGRSLA